MDVSDIFYFFFCSGAGEKEVASEEVAGGSVFIKNRGRGGGFARRSRGWGKGAGGMSVGEGGGLNIFFRAQNSHQVCVLAMSVVSQRTAEQVKAHMRRFVADGVLAIIHRSRRCREEARERSKRKISGRLSHEHLEVIRAGPRNPGKTGIWVRTSTTRTLQRPSPQGGAKKLR